MAVHDLLRALAGGALIGLAASLALVGNGRIAGICGILGQVFVRDDGQGFRLAFLGGLIAVGVIAAGVAPGAIGAAVHGLPIVAIGGLLVGVGATVGNGCTSGHGVCGLARGSSRSLVSVLTFMSVAAITVAVVGGGR
jgi:hypothetical protein